MWVFHTSNQSGVQMCGVPFEWPYFERSNYERLNARKVECLEGRMIHKTDFSKDRFIGANDSKGRMASKGDCSNCPFSVLIFRIVHSPLTKWNENSSFSGEFN